MQQLLKGSVLIKSKNCDAVLRITLLLLLFLISLLFFYAAMILVSFWSRDYKKGFDRLLFT